MNLLKRVIALFLLGVCCGPAVNAQYYQAVNQATNMLSNALTGGFNYRGMVDASYTVGVGKNGCSSLEFSTTQGFKYAGWFYMGVGAGVNVVFSDKGNSDVAMFTSSWGNGYDPRRKVRDTGVLLPLFTDFRFLIGKEEDVSMYMDFKVGASFLIGKNYLQTPDGYLDSSEGFYFKPTIGVRVPVNGNNSKQAINFGVSYQLITNSYWDRGGYYSGTTVNSLGASIGFEW